jgi:chromosome segregation ATPase
MSRARVACSICAGSLALACLVGLAGVADATPANTCANVGSWKPGLTAQIVKLTQTVARVGAGELVVRGDEVKLQAQVVVENIQVTRLEADVVEDTVTFSSHTSAAKASLVTAKAELAKYQGQLSSERVTRARLDEQLAGTKTQIDTIRAEIVRYCPAS